MKPRNPNKPFLIPGSYAVLWFDKNFKHISTEPSNLNRIALRDKCEQSLHSKPKGTNYVIVMPIHSSVINPWTSKDKLCS